MYENYYVIAKNLEKEKPKTSKATRNFTQFM